MQNEINRAKKLIERKQAFILNVENQRTKDAIAAEINIINGLIFQLNEQQNTANHLKELTDRNAKADAAIIQKLYMLCIMHGIPVNEFVFMSNEALKADLLADQKEGYTCRIPEKLKPIFFELQTMAGIPDEKLFLSEKDQQRTTQQQF